MRSLGVNTCGTSDKGVIRPCVLRIMAPLCCPCATTLLIDNTLFWPERMVRLLASGSLGSGQLLFDWQLLETLTQMFGCSFQWPTQLCKDTPWYTPDHPWSLMTMEPENYQNSFESERRWFSDSQGCIQNLHPEVYQSSWPTRSASILDVLWGHQSSVFRIYPSNS